MSLWLSVDPLAEKFLDFSPYAYTFNNPINFVDPTGMEGEWHWEGKKLVADEGDNAETLATFLKSSTTFAKSIIETGNYWYDMVGSGGGKTLIPGQENIGADLSYLKPDAHQSFSGWHTALPLMPDNKALSLINSGRVTFANIHPSGVIDNAFANNNISDISLGKLAHRSSYGTAPGGQVNLRDDLLSLMIGLSENYTYHVSELAGASHSSNSRHYAGIALDVTIINGLSVNINNPYIKNFMQQAKDIGATEVLGPGTRGHGSHIHIAMPR